MGNRFGGTWRHHPLSDLTGHVLSSGSPCSLFCEMHAARLPVLVKGPLILDFLTAVSVEHTNRSTSGEVPVDWFFYRDLLWLRLKRSLPWTRFLRKSRCCQNSHLGLEINRLVYRKQPAWLAMAPGLPFTWAQRTTHTKTGSSRMAPSDFQSRSHWHYRDFSSLGPWAQQNPLPRALTPAFTPQPRGTAGHAGSARSDPKHRKVCIPRWFDPHRYLHRRARKENNCHSSPMEASLGTSTANHRLYLLDTFWPVLSFSMTPEWKKFTPDQRWRRLSLGLMHQCNKIDGRGQQGFLPLIRVKVSNKLNSKERHQINYT